MNPRVSLLGTHELLWKEWLPDDGATTDLSVLRSYGEICQVESFWEHYLIVEKKIILSWCLRSSLGISGCLMLAWDHLLSLKIQQVHWSLEETGKEHLNVSKEIQQPETLTTQPNLRNCSWEEKQTNCWVRLMTAAMEIAKLKYGEVVPLQLKNYLSEVRTTLYLNCRTK